MPRGARLLRIVGVPALARASEVQEYLGLPPGELGCQGVSGQEGAWASGLAGRGLAL